MVGIAGAIAAGIGVWNARTLVYSRTSSAQPIPDIRLRPETLEQLTQEQAHVTQRAAWWVLAGTLLQVIAGLLALIALLQR